MKENSQEKQEPIDSQKAHKSIGARIGSVYKRAKAYLEGKKDSVLSSIEKNYQKLSHAVTGQQEKDAPQSIKSTVEPKDKSTAGNIAPKPSKINKEQAKKYLKAQGYKENYIEALGKLGQSSPPAWWKKKTREEKFHNINQSLYARGGDIAMGSRSVEKVRALFQPLVEQHATELKTSITQGQEAFQNKIKELLSTPLFLEKVKEQIAIEVKFYNQLYEKNIHCMALAGVKIDKKLDKIIKQELLSGLGFAEHQHDINFLIEDIAKWQAVNIDFQGRIDAQATKNAQSEKTDEVEFLPQETTFLYQASALDNVPKIEESEKQEEKEEQVELEQVTYDPEAESEVLVTEQEPEEQEPEEQEQEEVLAQSDEKKPSREESPKIAQKDDPNTQSMPVMNTDSLLSKLQSALEGSTATLGVKARIAQFEGHTTEKKVESKKSQDSETIPQRTQVKSMINMFNSYQKSQHTERAVDPETPEKSRSVKLR